MKKHILLVIGVMTTLILPASAFAGHFSGISSVDAKEIRYEGSTKYNDAKDWAIDQWNALGKVKIAPDTWWTYADVKWADITIATRRWGAVWVNVPGTDYLYMNDDYLPSASDFMRRLVAAHEMGHALGIDDHYEDSYSNILMYYAVSSANTPQSHDIDDYNSLWK
jgi:hypothetical protein